MIHLTNISNIYVSFRDTFASDSKDSNYQNYSAIHIY